MEEDEDAMRRDAEVEAIVAIFGGDDGAWVDVHPFPQSEELRQKGVQTVVSVTLPELSHGHERPVVVRFG
jgi:hypothetical protein